jgi:hypothetical protein
MSDSEPILHVGRRFHVSDRAQALDLLAAYNLGSLISAGVDGWPRASSSPLIIYPTPTGSHASTPTSTGATRRSNTCGTGGHSSTPPTTRARTSRPTGSRAARPHRPTCTSPSTSAATRNCSTQSAQPGCCSRQSPPSSVGYLEHGNTTAANASLGARPAAESPASN